jgi:uncharacterized protein (DUF58 family)
MSPLRQKPESQTPAAQNGLSEPRALHRAERRVQRRLTPAGWLFLLLAISVGLAAVRSQAPLLFFLCGAMLGALPVSALVATRMVRRVQARREVPARAWQNQVVHIGYYLRATRRSGSCLSLSLRERRQSDMESVAGYCADLPAGRLFRAGARFTPSRRGRIDLRGMEISTTFPFGLVLARRWTEQTSSLIVWPEKGLLHRQLLHRGAAETSSAPPSRNSGGQDEFFGLREYRTGDNPRWIHWRRSAMWGIPILREMARPLPEILWLILDTSRSETDNGDTDSFERSLRFAATLSDHAFLRGYEVGLGMMGAAGPIVLNPAMGRGQRGGVLDAIAEAEPTRQPLDDLVGALSPARLREAQVIVVTAQPGGPPPQCLGELRNRCRHLTHLDATQLGTVFDDLALGSREPA